MNAPDLSALVRRLYDARLAAAIARKATQLKAAELGQCDGVNHDDGPCYQGEAPIEDWCDICKVKNPLWEERQRTSALAGAALRKLMRVAKLLPPL